MKHTTHSNGRATPAPAIAALRAQMAAKRAARAPLPAWMQRPAEPVRYFVPRRQPALEGWA